MRPSPRSFKYWGSCIGLPGELVGYLVDDVRAEGISYTTFSRHADLKQMRADKHPATYRMSCRDNWSIGFWRSRLPSGKQVYYFDWSRIEHVFVDGDVDLEHEMVLLKEHSAKNVRPLEGQPVQQSLFGGVVSANDPGDIPF